MAEQDTTPTTEGTTTQTGSADQSGQATEPKTFTQADVDRIVKERLSRAKATPPADYEEYKAKAARLDELEAANKSDLEKANDAATKAKAEAADWKAKFEAAQSEQERQRAVTQMAAQYKVDAGTLARMSGEVEDNAKYLAGLEAARPKYGVVVDNGDQPTPPQSLDDALKGARNESERIRIRAEFNARNRNR